MSINVKILKKTMVFLLFLRPRRLFQTHPSCIRALQVHTTVLSDIAWLQSPGLPWAFLYLSLPTSVIIELQNAVPAQINFNTASRFKVLTQKGCFLLLILMGSLQHQGNKHQYFFLRLQILNFFLWTMSEKQNGIKLIKKNPGLSF